MNVALKTAIVESRKTQRQIARLARIAESDLSHIVRGRRIPTEKERQALARTLHKAEADLFADEAIAS